MTNKSIEIKVNATAGVITYSEPKAHVKKHDKIQWESQAGPFAIQFTGATPIEYQGNHSTVSNGTGGHVLTGQVGGDKGDYLYACSVYADGKVYLDARCPVIIIDL